MHFGVLFWPLIALSVAAAVLFGLVFEKRKPSFLRAGVKTLFMGALALAFAGGAPLPFVIALAAAALGDFFLAFDKPWVLPLGMLAFLAMQLLYMVCFFALWMFSGDNAPLFPRYLMMIAIVLIVGAYLVWFWREPRPGRNPLLAIGAVLGAFAIGAAPLVIGGAGYLATLDPEVLEPKINWLLVGGVLALSAGLIWLRRDLGLVKLAGMIYAAVIVQMGLLSFWLPWTASPAMLGALLFLISDGVLSAELFRLSPEAPARKITGPVVWWTYAAAQLLIVWGVARTAGMA
jgi:uncharacterized membrane protein YhhN